MPARATLTKKGRTLARPAPVLGGCSRDRLRPIPQNDKRPAVGEPSIAAALAVSAGRLPGPDHMTEPRADERLAGSAWSFFHLRDTNPSSRTLLRADVVGRQEVFARSCGGHGVIGTSKRTLTHPFSSTSNASTVGYPRI